MPEKLCSNCEKTKPINQFYNDNRGKFGVESICKRCRYLKTRESYHKNIEHYRQYFRQRHRKQEWKKYQNQYYLKNKRELLEKAKAKPDYLEKKNIRWHRRKAKLLETKGQFTLKEWNELKKKFDYTCQMCGKKEPEIKLTKDHIIALDNGGNNAIDNIQPLCQSCNSKKGIKQ